MRGRLLVHVSHEATRTLGGVGVVLERLLESPAYREAFPRTLLVSPLLRPSWEGSYAAHESLERELGARGEVLYSGLRGPRPERLARLFQPVESRHGVSFVYGRRPAGGASVEVLLVDFSDVLRGYHLFMPSLPDFLRRLRESLGMALPVASPGGRSAPYRWLSALWRRAFGVRWGASRPVNGLYRQAVRRGLLRVPPLDHDGLEGLVLAEPVYEAVRALCLEEGLECVLLAQEHRALPLAYKARLEGEAWCRTVYYAGEVRTARTLVEYGAGGGASGGASELRFYQVLRQGLARGLTVDALFPVQDWLDFQLLRHGHRCERVGAVGESVARELRFLDRGFQALPLPVIPHGHQPIETSWQARRESRERVLGHLREALGLDCRLLLTHIARDAVCKALGRDVTLCEFLAELLPPEARPAVLLLITEWEPGAPSEEIGALRARVADFNARQEAMHLHLLNQADWPRGHGFTREDLHRATDVTLGQSMYESFGLAQLEPLGCGALCVLSGVSGARYRVRELCARLGTSEEAHPNVVVADYAAVEEAPGAERSVEDWLPLGEEEREGHERRCARGVARRLVEKLPWDEAGQRRLMESGRQLAERMAWEPLIREQLVPFLRDGWGETSTDRRDT